MERFFEMVMIVGILGLLGLFFAFLLSIRFLIMHANRLGEKYKEKSKSLGLDTCPPSIHRASRRGMNCENLGPKKNDSSD